MDNVRKALSEHNPTRRTLCEMLREIYDLTEDPRIRSRCEEALMAAKKMDAKLKQYRRQYDLGMWEKKTK